MSNPTARPTPSPEPSPRAWLLGPSELDAIRRDDALLDALARGDVPDPSNPLGRLIAAFVAEIEDGGAR
jgi:hypothetical protein